MFENSEMSHGMKRDTLNVKKACAVSANRINKEVGVRIT